jgi:hypothetical protein
VIFSTHWRPARFETWEGPFADPNERLPQGTGRGGAAPGGNAAMAGASKELGLTELSAAEAA